jgi:adenylate cyclase class 2
MIEAERKFRIEEKDIGRFQDTLDKLEFEKGAEQDQSDSVFLGKGHTDFSTFTPGDPVARVRRANKHVTMTVKRSLTDGASIERETVCDSYEESVGIFDALGMNRVVEISKRRQEYKKEGVTVAIDNVKGLGFFIEIELLADEGTSLDELEKRIMNLAETIGLDPEDLENNKYDALISRQNKE